jgi:hypothetical protein
MPNAYTITRVNPNGSETVLKAIPVDQRADNQVARAALIAEAFETKGSRRYIVYGPSDSPTLLPDDRIWDSARNLEP